MGNFEYLYTKSAILLFALFVNTGVYSNCVELCPSGREIHVSSSRGNQSFDKMGGVSVSLKEDYWGKRRKSKITYCPGPIEFEAKGLQMIKVFCEDEKIVL